MKTNLTSLMGLISEYEKTYSNISYRIKNYVYNTSIQELNGTINIIEDNKEQFLEDLANLEKLNDQISKLKGILYKKNNELKLSDGRTIQTAIVENTNLRKLKSSYELLLNYKSSKNRVTEVNNSYFEIREINFSQQELKAKVELIDKNIQQTDFEISKLNCIEFEI